VVLDFCLAAWIASFLLVHKPSGESFLKPNPFFERERPDSFNAFVAVDRKRENHVLVVVIHFSDFVGKVVYWISFFIFYLG